MLSEPAQPALGEALSRHLLPRRPDPGLAEWWAKSHPDYDERTLGKRTCWEFACSEIRVR